LPTSQKAAWSAARPFSRLELRVPEIVRQIAGFRHRGGGEAPRHAHCSLRSYEKEIVAVGRKEYSYVNQAPILALNETRKTLLASRLRLTRAAVKAPGARAPVFPGDGLWVEPCIEVDTTGLPVSLDLLFLDEDHRVVESVTAMRPGGRSPRVSQARGVLELPAGTIPATHTEIGDRILIEPIVPASSPPRGETAGHDT
jgi:hypothetical protein